MLSCHSIYYLKPVWLFPASRGCHGWSLVEVLAVLSLLLLTGHILLPNWAQGLSQSHFQQQHQAFLLHLRQARASAQNLQQPVALCGWDAHSACVSGWPHHIVSFVDSNRDGQWQESEQLLHRQKLSQALSINFNRGAYVLFSALGASGQSGTWELCWSDLEAGQVVVLSTLGSMRSAQSSCLN
ncbi:MAG: GspH/FimT family protein [Gammaproteobacteria bacterium]|jgi:Tfp pilus assembly protein FimT|nr:GspH/FimT family protein [Gammaproteobacteria bacterium]